VTTAPALAGFQHRFDRAPGNASRTLLLLHGTGADENDLIPLGTMLDPNANLLSPRGPVLEYGMPRFFKRLAEGVFDLADLERRTLELAAFLDRAAEEYRLDRSRVFAAGFSNGANIAANVLLIRPRALAGALLFSPMLPFDPAPPAAPFELRSIPVFIASGRADSIAPLAQAERLKRELEARGADVTLEVGPGGHGIDARAANAARDWIAAR
jgi:predicted esterase